MGLGFGVASSFPAVRAAASRSPLLSCRSFTTWFFLSSVSSYFFPSFLQIPPLSPAFLPASPLAPFPASPPPPASFPTLLTRTRIRVYAHAYASPLAFRPSSPLPSSTHPFPPASRLRTASPPPRLLATHQHTLLATILPCFFALTAPRVAGGGQSATLPPELGIQITPRMMTTLQLCASFGEMICPFVMGIFFQVHFEICPGPPWTAGSRPHIISMTMPHSHHVLVFLEVGQLHHYALFYILTVIWELVVFILLSIAWLLLTRRLALPVAFYRCIDCLKLR